MVRDVPEVRGSWYRGHSSSQAQSQSFEQPGVSAAPGLQPATQPPKSAPQTPCQSQAPQVQPTPAASQMKTAGSKPSFAALFAKHPAIKEEPTTPGGSLLSETPPPASVSPIGAVGGTAKRSVFSRQPAAEPDKSSQAALQAQLSADQMNKIESLFKDLKKELKQEIAQLTGVPPKGGVSELQPSVRVGRGSSDSPSKKPSRASGSVQTSHLKSQTGEPSSLQLRAQRDLEPSSDGSSRERESSKSPHRSSGSSDSHRHHRHRHHHHHHKADHSTPQATPESSHTDLRSEGQLRDRRRSGARRATTDTQESGSRDPHMVISMEQSDDDQDATSKL